MTPRRRKAPTCSSACRSPPAPANNRRLVVHYVTVEVPDERNDKGEIVKVHAKESKDYEWTSGTVTFNSGDTAKTVRVPTINDTAQDDREKFKLVASTLKYYTRSQGTWSVERQEDNPYLDTVRKRAGIGTIRNTDPVGLLSVADAEAAEEDATIDFVVTLNLGGDGDRDRGLRHGRPYGGRGDRLHGNERHADLRGG